MANKIGIVLALDGEREFTQGMKNAQQSAKLCDQELKNLKKEYSDNANSLEALTKKEAALKSSQEALKRTLEQAKTGLSHAKDQYKKCGQALDGYKKDLEKAKSALKDMEKAGDTSSKAYQDQAKAVADLEKAVEKQSLEYSKASGNITKWETAVSKADADVRKNSKAVDQNAKYLDEAKNSADHCATSIDKFGKEVKEAGADAKTAGGEVKSLGDKLKDGAIQRAGALATNAVAAIGSAAVDAAKKMVEVGSEFEASMSKVEALSGASGSDLEALSAKAQEMGRTTRYSASEAADALGYMALAGWDTNEMLAGIDGVLSLAAASGMDLAEASDIVTDYLSAFNLEASDASRLADQLAFAQAHSNTTTQQLADAFGNCAANMNAAGQDVETTTSFLEAFANQGVKGSEAGTKLSAIMRDITAKMKDGKIQIGNTAVAVTDANGNFRDLTDIMIDVEAATEGMGDAERAAALSATFTSRSVGGLNMILNEGMGNISGYEKDLRNANGAASDMAGTMQNNLKGALAEANSAAEGLGIAVYDHVSGPLTGAVNLATGIINGITDAITPQKTALDNFLNDTKTLHNSVQQAIQTSQNALTQGQADIASLDATVEIIKNANEQFGIFAATDTSGVVSDVTETSNGLTDPLSSIASGGQEAAAGLEGIGEAEVTAPGSLSTAAEGVKTDTGKIVSAEQGAENALEGLGDAAAGTPDTATAKDSVNTDMTAISEDVTTVQEALQGLSETEVEGIDLEGVASSLRGANYEVNQAELAVQSLAQQIPAIGDAWDDTTKTLKMTEAEFDALINQQKRLIMSQAIEAAKSSAVTAYTQALVEQKMAQSGLNEVLKEASELSGREITTYEELTEIVGGLEDVSDVSLREYADSMRDLGKKGKEAAESVKGADENVAAATETMNKCDAAAKEVSEELGFVADSGNEMADGTRNASDAAGEASDELIEKFKAIQQNAEEAGQTVRDEFNAMKDAILNTFDFNLGDMWEGGIDQTVEDLTAALDSQIEGMTNYEQNLATIKDHVGQEIAPEFMEYLEGMGSDGANTLAHIVATLEHEGQAGSDKVKSMSDKWVAAMDQKSRIASILAADQIALKIGLGEFGSSAEEWEGLSGVVSALEASGAQISEETRTAFEQAATAAQEAGVTIPEGLAEGIEGAGVDGAEAALIAATQVLQTALSGQIDELVRIASENGVQVSSELAAAVEAGGPDAAAAAQEIINQITEKLSEAEESASTSGESVGSEFASAAEGQAGAATSAAEAVASGAAEGANSKAAEFQTAGTTAGGNYISGLMDRVGTAGNAGKALAASAHLGASGNSFSFQAAGGLAGSSYVSGINSYASSASGAGSNLASAAKSGASGVGGFSGIGYNMAAGIASGISSGQSVVVSAMVAAVTAGINAAKAKAGIASPSKATRDLIGKQLSRGIAAGITAEDGYVEATAEAQMNKLLEGLRGWIAKNRGKLGKNSEQVAESISYAWQQLGARAANNNFWVSQNDKAYEKYTKGSNKGKLTVQGTEKYYADVYKAAQNYLKNVKTLYDVSDEETIEYWRKVRDSLKRGTQAWYDATAQINNAKENIKQEQERVAQEQRQAESEENAKRLARAEHFADRQKILYNRSAKWELEYWIKVRKSLKAGSEEYQQVTERIQDLRVDQAEEEKEAARQAIRDQRQAVKDERAKILSDAEDYVNRKKALDKMSIKDEVAYWQKIREKLKKGTEEYNTVTQNIYNAKKQIGSVDVAESLLGNYQIYYDMSEKAEMQYWARVRKLYKAGTADRIKADKQYLAAKKEYNDRLKAIEDDYADKIKSANETYKDELERRKEQIMSAYNLEDYFESSSATGKELLYNLQTQAAGYAEWNKSVQQLQNKGILSDDLMTQLIDKGPNSIATIKALLTLTNDELKKYQKAYDEKEKQALSRAQKDTADTKASVAKEIESLKKQRTKELAEVKKDIGADILSLAGSIKTIASDQTDALVAAFRRGGNTSKESTGGNVSKQTQKAAGVDNAAVRLATKAAAYQGSLGISAANAVKVAQYVEGHAKFGTQLSSARAAQATAEKAVKSAESNYNTAHATFESKKDAMQAAKKAVTSAKTAAQKKSAQDSLTKATTAYDKAKTASQKAKASLTAAQRTLAAKQKALDKLLAVAYKGGKRTGSRRLGSDGLVWMDELLGSVGPEMIVRKSDNAILTRAQASDAIIPANLADNLFKWGAIDPTALNTASMATLNQKLLEGYQASTRASAQQTARMDEILGLMAEFLPYLAEKTRVTISSREAAEAMSADMSRTMAANVRRIRR